MAGRLSFPHASWQNGSCVEVECCLHPVSAADVMKAYDVFGNAAQERALKAVLEDG